MAWREFFGEFFVEQVQVVVVFRGNKLFSVFLGGLCIYSLLNLVEGDRKYLILFVVGWSGEGCSSNECYLDELVVRNWNGNASHLWGLWRGVAVSVSVGGSKGNSVGTETDGYIM